MSNELRKLVTYFALFDGKNDWDTIKPRAIDLGHPDITIVLGDGAFKKGKEEWLASVKTFAKSGGQIDMIYFEAMEDDENPQVKYKLNMHMPGGGVSTVQSTGTFKDGYLIRVQPNVGIKTYEKLFEGSGVTSPADVAVGQ